MPEASIPAPHLPAEATVSREGCALLTSPSPFAHAQNRPTVVLLHSLGTDHRLWRHQASALGNAYRTLRPDSRGHGSAPWTGLLTVEDWVADLHHALEGCGPVHLVGLSMGGVQAAAYAGTHPKNVRSLVIANSFARLATDVAAERVRTATEAIAGGDMAAYARHYLAQTLTRTVDGEDYRALCAAIGAVRPDAYLRSAEVTFGADLTRWLPTVDVPTLVLAGELDRKTPLDKSQEIAETIPGATLEVVSAAGHLSCIENPAEFTAILTAFLADVESAQPQRRGDVA